MQTKYRCLWLFILPLFSKAQDLITDGSFEQLSGTEFINSAAGNGEGANLNNSKYWTTRTKVIGTSELHCPDWIWYPTYEAPRVIQSNCTVNDFDGYDNTHKYVRSVVGYFELFEQHLVNPPRLSSADNPTTYIISMAVRTNYNYDAAYCKPVDNSLSIGCYFAKKEIEFKSENNVSDYTDCKSKFKTFKRGIYNSIQENDLTIDMNRLWANNQWTPIFFPVTGDISEYRWFGIMPGTENYANCQDDGNLNWDVLYFDGISVSSSDCFCPVDLWIQDMTYSANATVIAQNTIKAGYDVGALTPVGPVTVAAPNIVSYQACSSITLEPGFSVQSGAVFTASIGCDCHLVDGDISFEMANAACCFQSKWWGFFSLNATWYSVDVVGENGALKRFSGPCVLNGTTYVNIDWQDYCGSITGNSYVVYLTLYNCANTASGEGAVVILPLDLCTPHVRMDMIDSIPNSVYDSTTNSNVDSIVMNNYSLYPNPFNNQITLTVGNVNQNTSAQITLFNSEGQPVKYVQQNIVNGTTTIHTSDLASAPYYAQVWYNGNCFHQAMVKISSSK